MVILLLFYGTGGGLVIFSGCDSGWILIFYAQNRTKSYVVKWFFVVFFTCDFHTLPGLHEDEL